MYKFIGMDIYPIPRYSKSSHPFSWGSGTKPHNLWDGDCPLPHDPKGSQSPVNLIHIDR